MPDQITNEAALHFIDQAVRLLQTLADAKKVIQKAVQADQVRVILEKRNERLRTENTDLASKVKANLKSFEEALREHKDSLKATDEAAMNEMAAKVAQYEQSIAALETKNADLTIAFEGDEKHRREVICKLDKQIASARSELAQVTMELEAIKARFIT